MTNGMETCSGWPTPWVTMITSFSAIDLLLAFGFFRGGRDNGPADRVNAGHEGACAGSPGAVGSLVNEAAMAPMRVIRRTSTWRISPHAATISGSASW